MTTTIEHVLKVTDQGSATMKAVAGAAGEAEVALERADTKADSFGKALGKAGGDSAKMRGALSLLSPELGNFAGLANDAFDAVEVLSSGMGAINPITIGVAAAVAAGGLAWIAWSKDAADAAQQAKNSRDALDGLKTVLDDLAQKQLALAVLNGTVTESQAAAIQAQRDNFAQLNAATEATRQRQDELHASQASLSTQFADLGARVVESVDYIGAATVVYGALTTSSADMGKELESLDAHIGRTVEATRKDAEVTTELVVAAGKAKGAKEGQATATKASTTAIDAERKAAAALRIEESMLESAEAGLVSIMRQVETAEQKARREYEERNKAIIAAIDLDLDHTAVLDAKSASLKILATDLKAARDADKPAPAPAPPPPGGDKPPPPTTEERAAAGLQTAAGGPEAVMSTIATNTGPVGAIVMAIIDIVRNAPDLMEMFSTFTSDLVEGIGDFIPSLLRHMRQTLGETIGDGIRLLIADLPIAIVDSLFMIFDPQFWKDIGTDLWNTLFEKSDSDEARSERKSKKWKEDFDTSGMAQVNRANDETATAGDANTSTQHTRGFDAGSTFIDRTGMAMVHRGEEVIPATGATTSRQASAAGRGGNPRGRMTAQGGRMMVEVDENEFVDAVNQLVDRGFSLSGTR